MNLRTVTEPICEPVSLAEARLACLIDDDYVAQDAYISGLITVARQYGEHYTGRSFIERELEATYKCFQNEFELPAPPLVYVKHGKYIDTDGALQTLDPSVYQVDTYAESGKVKLAYNQTWPSIRASDYNAVQWRYVAGYAQAGSPTEAVALQAAVPASIKQWMKMRVMQWFQFRTPIVVGTIVANIPRDFIDGLLDPYKVYKF
jgi:uncharacterized phiE125 gp8 family phage protein